MKKQGNTRKLVRYQVPGNGEIYKALCFRKKSEQGTFMLFFAAGILPLLMFMMALSIDITSYMRADERLQETADDAAILAWHYLPYQIQALEAVNRFISQRGLSGTIAQLRMAPARPGSENFNDEFEVILEQQQSLTFMSFLAQDAALQLRAISRTRSTPSDVYIAVDRSAYVAPSLLSDPWNNPEVSDYFRNNAPFTEFIEPENGLLVTKAPAAFMTQLCFNPYFAAMKKTALTLYEYLAALGRNGVGIGVFPGVGTEYLRNLRAVLRPGQYADCKTIGSGEAFPLQIAAVRNQQDYYEYASVRLGASSWCAAAAAQDDNFTAFAPYGIGNSSRIEKIWKSFSSIPKNKNEITRVDRDDVVFNSDYQSDLSVREALWSAIAKNAVPNSRGVLDAVISNLAITPDSEAIDGVAIRGGLIGTSTRTGIILAGDIPYFNGIRFDNQADSVAAQLSQSLLVLRKLVTDNPNLRFKLVYIIVGDPSRPAISVLSDLEDRATRLADFFENEKNLTDLEGRLDLQVIYSNDFRKLSEQVLATVVLDNNRKVLSY